MRQITPSTSTHRASWIIGRSKTRAFDLLHVDTGRRSLSLLSKLNSKPILPPPRRITVAIAFIEIVRRVDGLRFSLLLFSLSRVRYLVILIRNEVDEQRLKKGTRLQLRHSVGLLDLIASSLPTFSPGGFFLFIAIVFFFGDNPLSMSSSLPCQYVAWANSFTASLFANRSPVFRILHFSASPASSRLSYTWTLYTFDWE